MGEKKKQRREKRFRFFKSFFAGFLVCGAGLDLLNLLFAGLTYWAMEQLLVKAAGSAIASLIAILARPIFRIIFKNSGGKTMKFFKKIGGFFKRVGQYLRSNKRTLGGIITSILTGTMATTVCVCGYTFDLTDIIARVSWLEWVKQVSVNGFDLTPIIAGVIIWLIALWNAVAAVSRGWESPEKYAAAEAERHADDDVDEEEEPDEDADEPDDDSDYEFDEEEESHKTDKVSTPTNDKKTDKSEVAISSTLNAGTEKAVSNAVTNLDLLIAKQKAGKK